MVDMSAHFQEQFLSFDLNKIKDRVQDFSPVIQVVRDTWDHQTLGEILEGRVYLTSLLASQVISNVPAALLLSGFTEEAKNLLLGVNIGGLGTPIASLASLISMKLYTHADHAHTGRYLAEFSLVNFLLLILLSVAQKIL